MVRSLIIILIVFSLSFSTNVGRVIIHDGTESVNVTSDSALEVAIIDSPIVSIVDSPFVTIVDTPKVVVVDTPAVKTDTNSFVNIGSAGIGFEMDNLGRYLVSLDIEHHMKHEGRFFDYHHVATAVGSGDSLVFLITTEDTTRWTHFLFEVASLKEATGHFFEGSSVSGTGTALTEINVNRNSAIASLTQIFLAPTLVSHGTDTIWRDHWGDTKKIGGERLNDELILNQNDTGTFRIISGAADNDIDVRFFWYELLNR